MNPHKEEPTLERERTPEFYEAEKGAFAHGFKLGMAYKEMEQQDAAAAPVLGGGCSS